jgi:hypothetical protein
MENILTANESTKIILPRRQKGGIIFLTQKKRKLISTTIEVLF